MASLVVLLSLVVLRGTVICVAVLLFFIVLCWLVCAVCVGVLLLVLLLCDLNLC